MCNHQPDWNLQTIVENLLDKVIAKDAKSADNYKTPQVLVMTQDTLQVVALYKALISKYRTKTDKKGKAIVSDKPKVQVWKLFARHISLKDQQEALDASVPEGQKVINVYIGTPNRIKELAKAETIRLDSKKFKMIVLDCSLNKKNCTMLETHETRDDCFGVIASAAPVL